GEQEHEEDRRLERLRDGDPNLSDQYACQQGGGDCAEADALESELAKEVADGQREKDRQFRVLTQRGEQPVNHEISPSVRDVSSIAWPPLSERRQGIVVGGDAGSTARYDIIEVATRSRLCRIGDGHLRLLEHGTSPSPPRGLPEDGGAKSDLIP